MKYGQRDVVDLLVFNEEGKLIAKLDSLKESNIYVGRLDSQVYVKDALLNSDILEFIGKKEKQPVRTDFENHMIKKNAGTTISFGKPNTKKCKLIAVSLLVRDDIGTSVEVTYEIPNATLNTGLNFEHSNVDPTDLDLVFNILPYNDEGDLYKMHIEE